MPGFYFDHRWCAPHGIGRFATEIRSRLSGWNDLPMKGYPTHPLDAFKLARCLNRENATLFFSPGFNVPAWSKCPSICTVHDLIHVHYAHQRSSLTLAYYRMIQRPIVRRSPLTLTVSEFSRQQIIEWYNVPEERVVCVGNGVSNDFTPDGKKVELEPPFFLYVGNLRPHKNTDVLLSAMNLIDADATLIMVLKPDKEIHRKIDLLNLTGRVRFVSGLSDQELAQYYRAATALILPSHFEGFGLPLVEAMACGCPVIASNRTSIPEVVGDAGVLFDPEDVEELTDAMTHALGGEDDTGVLVERGLKRAEHFQWKEVAHRVKEAIDETVGGP